MLAGRRGPAWMAKPYSMDLRARVVGAVEKDGLSRHEAASRFGVGVSTAINWVRRFRETGSVAPGQIGGHKPKAIRDEHETWLRERIRERDFTLRGLVAELAARGLKVDYRAVWNFVHARKLSFKKTVLASEQDRPDVARRRAQWRRYQNRIDSRRLIFIDETWTFLAALRHDRIDAPWLLDGPIDAESFQTYIKQVLVPSLKPGDIVVMDN